MSYIRCGYPMRYVKGKSKDYVWKGEHKGKEYIEDYGRISDSGFIELLMQEWKTKDKVFKEHFIKRLARRLKVKLRKKPLTDKEWFELSWKDGSEKEDKSVTSTSDCQGGGRRTASTSSEKPKEKRKSFWEKFWSRLEMRDKEKKKLLESWLKMRDKHLEAIAWHLCLLLSDDDMDRARKKFKELIKEI